MPLRLLHHSRLLAASLLPFATVATCAAQRSDFYVHPGDKVLFYGDSITDQRLYTQIIETYIVTRYPTLPVTFVNSGWGGDTVSGGGGGDIDTRLARDVTPYKPTIITIMLGMNDGGYKEPTAANDEKFFNGYRHIIESLNRDDHGARITAIEPSPYDNVTRAGTTSAATAAYNQVLVGFGKWIATYGEQHNLTLADANTDFVEVLRKADAANPTLAKEFLPDRIHPTFGGAMLLAEAVLKAWRARAVVASVDLKVNGDRAKIAASDHTSVTALSYNNGGLQWTQLDDGLPLPFAQWSGMWGGGPAIGAAIDNSDLTTALNQEPLRITGLKSGNYKLSIDNTEVGVYNDAQLAAGINLALLKTPMTTQAMAVYQLTTQHGDIHYDRWRHIEVPLATYKLPSSQPAMDALDKLEAAVVAEQHSAAQPKAHTFAVEPVQ